jgi:hypothetical protein
LQTTGPGGTAAAADPVPGDRVRLSREFSGDDLLVAAWPHAPAAADMGSALDRPADMVLAPGRLMGLAPGQASGQTVRFFSEAYLRELLAGWRELHLDPVLVRRRETGGPLKHVWRGIAGR